jgi:hypothetical protein
MFNDRFSFEAANIPFFLYRKIFQKNFFRISIKSKSGRIAPALKTISLPEAVPFITF